MTNAERHFVKGVGVYSCECCKRATRIVRDQAAYFARLCEPCYDLGGLINLHSDEGHAGDIRECATCGEEARKLIARGAAL